MVVNARQHTSNPAMLTEWRGQFRYTVDAEGSLKQEMTFNVRLRADIRKWRPKIHKPPEEPGGLVRADKDSTCQYACSGTAVWDAVGDGRITYRVTWSGSGQLQPREPGMRHFFEAGGLVDNSRRIILDFVAEGVLSWTSLLRIVLDDGSIIESPNSGESCLSDPRLFLALMPPKHIQLTLDENGNIQAGAVEANIPEHNCAITPSDNSLRIKMSWDDIQATNPPNPDSAR